MSRLGYALLDTKKELISKQWGIMLPMLKVYIQMYGLVAVVANLGIVSSCMKGDCKTLWMKGLMKASFC